jgi:nucleotide-binding universal stress UspA family protein
MYEHVIVPLDRTKESEQALVPGRWLADRLGATLVLVSAVADPDHVAAREQYLRDVLAEVDQRTGEVVVRVTLDPSTVILAEHQRLPGSLICMASHGPGRASEATFGSVTGDVVRQVPGPVLLVGPHTDRVRSSWTSVVACLDGSGFAEAVLDHVGPLVDRARLGLTLIEVIEPSAVDAARREVGGDVLEAGYLERIGHDQTRQGRSASWETLHGAHPARVIVGYAQQDSGAILALATHGRTGLRRLLMGSVAMRVVHESPSPVLVIQGPRDEH